MNDTITKIATIDSSKGDVFVSATAHINPTIDNIIVLDDQLNGTRSAFNGDHRKDSADDYDFVGYQRHKGGIDFPYTYRVVVYYGDTGSVTKTITFTTNLGTYNKTINISGNSVQTFDLDMSDVRASGNEIYKVEIATQSYYTHYLYLGEVVKNPTTSLPTFNIGDPSDDTNWNALLQAPTDLMHFVTSPMVGVYNTMNGGGEKTYYYGVQLSSRHLYVSLSVDQGGCGSCSVDCHWYFRITLNGYTILDETYKTAGTYSETYKIDLTNAMNNKGLSLGDVAYLYLHNWSDCQYQQGGISVYDLTNRRYPDASPLHTRLGMSKLDAFNGDEITKDNCIVNIRDNMQWLRENSESWLIPTAPRAWDEGRWYIHYDHKRPYLHGYSSGNVSFTIYWYDGSVTQNQSWSLKNETWDTFDLSKLDGIYDGSLVRVYSDDMICVFVDDVGWPTVS